MRIDSENRSVAVRQMYPGVTTPSVKASCFYFIYQRDWNITMKTATGYVLEVVTKVVVMNKFNF